MEDVLEVYPRPCDPTGPLVCPDETGKPRVAETRPPLPAKPGQPERVDHAYARGGTANPFMLFEPLTGRRHVTATGQRAAVDFAKVVRAVPDVRSPHAKRVGLTMDHLNPHRPAARDEAFAPAVARRLVERLEIHHPPSMAAG